MGKHESFPSGSSDSNGQYVRTVILPSGRVIKVVYFESANYRPKHEIDGELLEDLTICPECFDRLGDCQKSRLVHPVEWQEIEPSQWEVLLRCPNCEWKELGVYDQRTVDKFDEEIDFRTAALMHDLQRLTKANMEEDTDRFIEALYNNQILPEDF